MRGQPRTTLTGGYADCLETGMGVHAAKRLPDFSYVGDYEYSLTCCTFNRHRWFTTASIVGPACTQLLQLSKEKRFEIPAYCFMPDHVHIIATGVSADSDLVAYWGSGLCSREALIETLYDEPPRRGG